jgi:hypothetical protein
MSDEVKETQLPWRKTIEEMSEMVSAAMVEAGRKMRERRAKELAAEDEGMQQSPDSVTPQTRSSSDTGAQES